MKCNRNTTQERVIWISGALAIQRKDQITKTNYYYWGIKSMIDFSSVIEPIKRIDWYQFTKWANQAILKRDQYNQKSQTIDLGFPRAWGPLVIVLLSNGVLAFIGLIWDFITLDKCDIILFLSYSYLLLQQAPHRCLDELVNNFNKTIFPAAKAIIFYIVITDLVTKSQLKTHVAYAALELSVKKLGEFNANDNEFAVNAKTFYRNVQTQWFRIKSYQLNRSLHM